MAIFNDPRVRDLIIDLNDDHIEKQSKLIHSLKEMALGEQMTVVDQEIKIDNRWFKSIRRKWSGDGWEKTFKTSNEKLESCKIEIDRIQTFIEKFRAIDLVKESSNNHLFELLERAKKNLEEFSTAIPQAQEGLKKLSNSYKLTKKDEKIINKIDDYVQHSMNYVETKIQIKTVQDFVKNDFTRFSPPPPAPPAPPTSLGNDEKSKIASRTSPKQIQKSKSLKDKDGGSFMDELKNLSSSYTEGGFTPSSLKRMSQSISIKQQLDASITTELDSTIKEGHVRRSLNIKGLSSSLISEDSPLKIALRKKQTLIEEEKGLPGYQVKFINRTIELLKKKKKEQSTDSLESSGKALESTQQDNRHPFRLSNQFLQLGTKFSDTTDTIRPTSLKAYNGITPDQLQALQEEIKNNDVKNTKN